MVNPTKEYNEGSMFAGVQAELRTSDQPSGTLSRLGATVVDSLRCFSRVISSHAHSGALNFLRRYLGELPPKLG